MSLDWLSASTWSVGDALTETILDDIFNNTLTNSQRERLLQAISTYTASGWSNDTTSYVDMTGTNFQVDGDRLTGQNNLRWEIVYYTVSGIGANSKIQLYNVTDAAAVSGSEVTLPESTAGSFIVLPASSSSYFSLVSGEKQYRMQLKSGTAGKAVYIRSARIVAVADI